MRRRARIRVIEHKAERTFAERLEERAREMLRESRQGNGRDTISALERELAMTVNHIDSARATHESLRRSLLQQELYLDTEIIQRTPRQPVHLDPRLPERDRLRDRLRELEKERRGRAVAKNETLRSLHDRLLDVMNRRDTLTSTA